MSGPIQNSQVDCSPDSPTEEHLIAFCDGSYKKVEPVKWKHSQWIHYTRANGNVVMINPANVNYIERTQLRYPK